MTFGIFTGLMPIMPFQIALAVALALLFKGSKITAALGTWISNPLNWYFIYYFNYKIGASILGLSERNRAFLSIMESVHHGEEAMVIGGKIASAGGVIIGAFLVGGLVMGFVTAIPSYFIFLKTFQSIKNWREERKKKRHWQQQNEGYW